MNSIRGVRPTPALHVVIYYVSARRESTNSKNSDVEIVAGGGGLSRTSFSASFWRAASSWAQIWPVASLVNEKYQLNNWTYM